MFLSSSVLCQTAGYLGCVKQFSITCVQENLELFLRIEVQL